MPTASPVAAIAKLSEELIALEDKYGTHNYRPIDVGHQPSQWCLDVRQRRTALSRLKYNIVSDCHCGLPASNICNHTSKAGTNDIRNYRCWHHCCRGRGRASNDVGQMSRRAFSTK